MPLSTTLTRAAYTGNGVTTTFAYPFRVLDASHLRVTVADVVQVSGYTVTGVNAANGGNVVFTSPPANGAVVVLERIVPLTQPVDTVNNETILENVIDTGFDRATMQIQQVDTRVSRALRLLDSDPFSGDLTLPTTDARKGGFLRFNETSGGAEIVQPSAPLLINNVAPTVAVFSGTGAQTQFTLPTAVTSANLLWVFVSGVYQQKSHYTTNGSQITFAVAPAAGTNNIEVVVLPSYAVGGGVVAGGITDSTTVGRAVLTAIDQAVARAELGLGSAATLAASATGSALVTAATPAIVRATAGVRAAPEVIAEAIASNSATLDVTGLNDTYDRYELELLSLVPANNDVSLALRVGTGAGPTWQAGASAYDTNGQLITSSVVFLGGFASGIFLSGAGGSTFGIGNQAGSSISGVVEFCNPEASAFPTFRFRTSYIRPTGNGGAAVSGAGYYGTSGAITGLRVVFSSGNIASGSVRLIGYRKA